MPTLSMAHQAGDSVLGSEHQWQEEVLHPDGFDGLV